MSVLYGKLVLPRAPEFDLFWVNSESMAFVILLTMSIEEWLVAGFSPLPPFTGIEWV